MSKLFGRAPVLAILLCAACGNSTATSTSGPGGGGGATASSSSASSSAASGTGGSMPGTMDCQLAIANTDANIDLTEFSAPAGQGSEKHPQMGPFQYGFAASAMTMGIVRLLNIGVGGPVLTQGMTYTIDDTSGGIVLLTLNDINGTTGEKDWTAMPGSTMTVDAITPGLVSQYQNVTFGLSNLVMQADTSLGAGNKATGSFKMSGKCTGAITKYQGG